MNVRVKLKAQWLWYGEKQAKLCKRKLDYGMTLYDVIGVDNIAIIVEAMQGTNLCHKSVWKDMGPSGDAVTLERVTTSRKVMGSIPECVIGIFR